MTGTTYFAKIKFTLGGEEQELALHVASLTIDHISRYFEYNYEDDNTNSYGYQSFDRLISVQTNSLK